MRVEEDLETHEKLNNQYLVMRAAMGKIGEPCKSLLEAFYVHHKNMLEIAAFFGYTNADNAKNQKYKSPNTRNRGKPPIGAQGKEHKKDR